MNLLEYGLTCGNYLAWRALFYASFKVTIALMLRWISRALLVTNNPLICNSRKLIRNSRESLCNSCKLFAIHENFFFFALRDVKMDFESCNKVPLICNSTKNMKNERVERETSN